MTLYAMKEKMAEIGAQIDVEANWIAENAGNPETPVEKVDERIAKRDELQKRFDAIKETHDAEERKSKEQVQQKAANDADPKKSIQKAKGEFYKVALMGGDVSRVTKEYGGLGAIPASDADLGYGDRFLPTNMATEILTEPFETNSLRTIEPSSNITGLEEPKMNFTIEEADLADVTDKEVAKEIETDGETISYGRFKTKISATIKDTVLHGSPLDIAGTVENGLRSALAIKEKMRAFDTAPDATHAHMSFYSTQNAIKKVYGDNMLKAILEAYGDLADFFAGNAAVVMRRFDYTNMIIDLANGAEALFGKKPEEIIGIPVVFNDRATIPVVGDFRYSKQNYDIGTMYDTDKDVKKGEYYFVVTAWGDHVIKLKSAFRLAVVGTAPTEPEG